MWFISNINYSRVVTEKQYTCNIAGVICLAVQSMEAGVKQLKDFSILFSFALLPFSCNFLFWCSADKNNFIEK